MSISKRVIKQRLQILLHRNEQNRKLKQSLFRKVRIARSVSEKEYLAEILLRLITGVVDVIEHQMKEYIEGSLANIPPAIAAQTLSAPAHNMFAEQTLGLADHL